MSATKPLKKLRATQTSLELSAPARDALRLLKRKFGISKTKAIELGALLLLDKMNAPQGRGM
jgi:hypothetical protein